RDVRSVDRHNVLPDLQHVGLQEQDAAVGPDGEIGAWPVVEEDAAAVGNVREEDPLAPAAGGVRGAVHPGGGTAGVDARGNLSRRIPPAGAAVLDASLVDELPVVGVVAGNADAVLSGHGEIAEGLQFRV